MDNKENLARLRWACRRGMLELDILLNRFVELEFQNFSQDQLSILFALLEESDLDLFDWIYKKEIPIKTEYRVLIEKIRQAQ